MKLFFPYTFVVAPGLLPAQFSYIGTMIRTVDSNYHSISVRRNNARYYSPAWPQKNQPAQLKNLACNP